MPTEEDQQGWRQSQSGILVHIGFSTRRQQLQDAGHPAPHLHRVFFKAGAVSSRPQKVGEPGAGGGRPDIMSTCVR